MKLRKGRKKLIDGLNYNRVPVLCPPIMSPYMYSKLSLWIPLYTGNARDLSQYGNHGTITGAVFKRYADRYSQVLWFDGVDDKVVITHHTSLAPVNSIRVACWLKREDTGQECMYSKYAFGIYGYKLEFASNNKLNFAIVQTDLANKSVASVNTITDSRWHLVVGVWDGTKIYLYIDGVRDTGSTAVSSILDTGNNATIGIISTVQPYMGPIADVKVLQTILTDKEEMRLYRGGLQWNG